MRPANICILTDAYKVTHWRMLPDGLQTVYSYTESRGGKFHSTIFFGLQVYLKEYFSGKILEAWMIDEAKPFWAKVFGDDTYFNETGWRRLLEKHNGRLPIKVKAVPEGTLVPTSNVLVTVENTDPEFPWLPGWCETLMFQAIWYGTTVATKSFFIKRLIKHFADMTGEEVSPFHLNDFGFRGASSLQTSGIGAAGHLVNFLGTDTSEGILCAMEYYDTDVCGFSVAASEHSTMLMYGPDGELAGYKNILKKFPKGTLSLVGDTYDYFHSTEHYIGGALKEEILARDGKVVARPDSGDPPAVSLKSLRILWDRFQGTINKRGYMILNPKVGIIYGDAMDYDPINSVLQAVTTGGFGISNIIFGAGGAILQKVDRDTQKMAHKASQGIFADGTVLNTRKTVVTDISKQSKAGRFKLIQSSIGLITISDSQPGEDILQTVLVDGVLQNVQKFEDVRARAAQAL
jgi:nicotinamide phosphoribosyltransferase